MADVQITVPVAEEPCEGYCQKEFMMLVDDDEFRTLHRIRRALCEQGMKVGLNRVADSRDTVRWLLQQVHAA